MPTQDRCTVLSKRSHILLSNIDRCIEIGIKLIAAFTAEEETLRTTVVPMLEATSTTGLTRMPGVYFDHLDTLSLCLIVDKAEKLGKAPTMQTSFVVNVLVVFASSHLRRLSNIGEIF